MSLYSAEWDVHLQGAEAVAWLERRGLAVGERSRPFHLFADEVVFGAFALRRVWSSALFARSEADDGRSEEFSAMFCVEGELTVHEDGLLPVIVGPGSLLVRQRSRRATIRTARPSAFIQIESERDRLLGGVELDVVGGESFEADPAVAESFVSLVTSLLNASVDPTSVSFSAIRRAIEAMLSALLLQRRHAPRYVGASSAERELFLRATALIAARADDPSLTLDSLAEALAVSKPHLIRAFHGSETTPIRHLKTVRAANAAALLRAAPFTRMDEYEAVARQTGFANARTMRRTIRRELGPDGIG
ncbi:AraC-like DNA-binding protein [Microbacterium resistens]|uniref:AraC-like DNA-binding protein n=1 Tax=Microbacterium resistens TaxID=156977 RepID=A0ABU1SBP1_9MICO|nr:hypothetical protein [Microbacterium resistens]MDR6866333.1 AraC-like DNA-binding protein [Microbacterium resistens]